MRENMQNSRTNRAAIFVYSYFLTARHASHYRSHATITSPSRRHHLRLRKKCFFLRFPSLVPSLSVSCKRPTNNQRRTKDEPKNSKIEKSTFLKWRSATERTPSIAPEKSPLWGLSAIHRMAQYILWGPHEIIVRPKGDKNFVSEWGERRHMSL